MRGISLPINTVIILGLAILVLVVLAYFFVMGMNPFAQTKYESALNQGCKKYMDFGQNTSEILVGDVNNDGIEDSLLDVCRLYYHNNTMDENTCKEKCRERFLGK